MGSYFLDRYLSGDCVRVWDELTQLGDSVRDPQYFNDANAVAKETMRRARLNVEQIIEKLDVLGYRFTADRDAELKPDPKKLPSIHNAEVFQPPKASVLDDLSAFEELMGGPLPLSCRSWWEQIGWVCLDGIHEMWNPGDPEGLSALVIWGFDQWSEEPWFSEPLDLRSVGGAGFQLSLERDCYAIQVPNAGADARIRPDLWFVPYLRHVFSWGGFPGWGSEWREPPWGRFPWGTERREPPMKELNFLREGLLQI